MLPSENSLLNVTEKPSIHGDILGTVTAYKTYNPIPEIDREAFKNCQTRYYS